MPTTVLWSGTSDPFDLIENPEIEEVPAFDV
jgi:hypothetical protein